MNTLLAEVTQLSDSRNTAETGKAGDIRLATQPAAARRRLTLRDHLIDETALISGFERGEETVPAMRFSLSARLDLAADAGFGHGEMMRRIEAATQRHAGAAAEDFAAAMLAELAADDGVEAAEITLEAVPLFAGEGRFGLTLSSR